MIGAIALIALGQCAYAGEACLCGYGSQWAVVGQVSSAGDGGFVVTGERFGPAPTEVPVAGPAGTRVLITDLGRPLFVSADGGLECAGLQLDATSYAPRLSTGSCDAALADAGLVQPPCHDVKTCGCSAAPSLLALLALISVHTTVTCRSMKRRGRGSNMRRLNGQSDSAPLDNR